MFIPVVFTAQHGFDRVDGCLAGSWAKGIYGEINRGVLLSNSVDNCCLCGFDNRYAAVCATISKDCVWWTMREGLGIANDRSGMEGRGCRCDGRNLV